MLKKNKIYYLVRMCCVCKGIIGLKWVNEKEMHQQASHLYCDYCYLQLFKGD